MNPTIIVRQHDQGASKVYFLFGEWCFKKSPYLLQKRYIPWVTAIPGNRWPGSGNTPGTSRPWPGMTSGVDLDRERPSFPGNDLARERPPRSTLTGNDLPSPGCSQERLFPGEVVPRRDCSQERLFPGESKAGLKPGTGWGRTFGVCRTGQKGQNIFRRAILGTKQGHKTRCEGFFDVE